MRWIVLSIAACAATLGGCSSSAPSLVGEPALNPSEGPEHESDSVLLHSGQLRRTWVDVQVGGRESGLSLSRTYRSTQPGDGLLGPGWYLGIARTLRREEGALVWRDAEGLSHRFVPEGERFLGPPGVYAVAEPVADGMRIRFEGGASERYDTQERLTGWADELGRVTDVTLDGNGRPARVERWDGEVIEIAYDASGRVSRATAGRTTREYRYDAAGRLVGVAWPAAPVYGPPASDGVRVLDPSAVTEETYAYDAAGRLSTITNANGEVELEIEHDSDGRVVEERWSGGETRFEYLPDATTRVTGREGWIWEYVHDAAGHAVEERQLVGADVRVTRRTYNEAGELTREVSPSGRVLAWEYDESAVDPLDRGNLLREIDGAPPDELTTITEHTRAQAVRRHRSGAGHRTTWRYEFDELEATLAIDFDGDGEQLDRDLNGDGRVGPDRPLPILVIPPEVTGPGGAESAPTVLRWDDDGLLVERIAPDGTRTTFENGDGAERGLPVRMVLDAGSDPHPRTGRPRRNQETRWTYDADRNENGVIEASSSTEREWDARGLLVRVVLDGAEARQGFDAAGRLVHRATPREGTDGGPDPVLPEALEWFDRNERGGVIAVHRDLGSGGTLTSRIERDRSGNTTRIERGGDVFTVEYQAPREPTRVLGPAGEIVVEIEHDADGRRVRTSPPGVASGARDSFDTHGRLAEHVALDGSVVTHEYDSDGQLIGRRVSSGAGARLAESRWHYDARGRLVRLDEAAFDAQTGAPLPDGPTSPGDGLRTRLYEWDEVDTLRAIVEDDGSRVELVFDALGAPARSVLPDGARSELEVDASGNVLSYLSEEFDPELGAMRTRRTDWTYDARSRPIRRADDEGRVWTYGYGSAGLLRSTDPALNEQTWRYDGLDRVIEHAQTPAADEVAVVTMAYDSAGVLSEQTDPNGNVTRWDRDERGRAVAVQHPGGARMEIILGADGKVEASIDPNGTTQSFTLGESLRLEVRGIEAAPGVLAPTEERYERDARGRVIAASADGIEIARRWSSMGHLLEETQPAGTFGYRYDSLGRLIGITYPDGLDVQYERDVGGRVIRVSADGELLASYVYSGAGRVRERTVLGRFVTQYGYAGTAFTGQPMRITHTDGATMLADHRIDRDPLGNVIGESRIEDGPASDQYTYDRMQRLVVAQLASGLRFDHTLDGAHNRVNIRLSIGPEVMDFPSEIGPRNQLLARGSRAFEYDANGNRTVDGPWGLVYDHRNRLVAVDRMDGTRVAYEHDALGRRVSFTETSATGTTTGTIGHGGTQLRRGDGAEPDCPGDDPRDVGPPTIYGEELGSCEEDLVLTLTTSTGGGTEARDLIWGGAPGETLPLILTGDDGRWVLFEDVRGSPSVVASELTGVVERYRYQPDGGRTLDVDSGGGRAPEPVELAPSRLPIGFAGYLQVPSWSYPHARARDYDPETGVWLQPDPIGDWGDEGNLGNAYAYVAASPITLIDPDGLFASADWVPFVSMDDHTPLSTRRLRGVVERNPMECIARANRNVDDEDDHGFEDRGHGEGHFTQLEYHGQPSGAAPTGARAVAMYNAYIARVTADVIAEAARGQAADCSYVTLLYGELLHAAQDVNSHRGMSNRDHQRFDPDSHSNPSFPERLRNAELATGQVAGNLAAVNRYMIANRVVCDCCSTDDVSPSWVGFLFYLEDFVMVPEETDPRRRPSQWTAGSATYMLGAAPGSWVQQVAPRPRRRRRPPRRVS